MNEKIQSDELLDGTRIRKGITCEKTLCHLCNSACRWCTVENAKNFCIFPRERNCKNLYWLM